MSEASESGRGLRASFKRTLDTLLATAVNRAELFSLELQEEKYRVIQVILCAFSVAALGMMTLTLVTFTIVVLFWDTGRLAALIGFSVLYLVGTLFAWRMLQSHLKSRAAFPGTINELKKD